MDQLGYRCKGCFDKEQEIQRIKGLSVAMNSDLKSLLTTRDAEIERARELIVLAEKRRQCWDCEAVGGNHKIGCAVWNFLFKESPAQPLGN